MLENIIRRLELASNVSELDAWRYATDSAVMSQKVRKWILEQLDEGINADDEIIGYYSYNNKQLKGRDTYNLDDTGLFRSTISSYGTSDAIIIVANGQKEDENIIDKYSVRVIELTQEHKLLFIEFILKEYSIFLRNVLQIN